LHKAARRIVARADVIVLEELNVRGMTRRAKGSVAAPGPNVAAKRGLNRALLDASFGRLATLIREKAECAVRTVVSVEARFSSQECSQCGTLRAKVAGEGASGAWRAGLPCTLTSTRRW
jgi:putative transposase